MIPGGYKAQFSPDINRFVQALEGYRPSFESLKHLSTAAGETGSAELRRAALGLQGLVQSSRGMAGAKRFGPKAPELYPSREQVVSHVLLSLSNSPNPGVKALAADLAARWFKGIVGRGEIVIYGKYV